MRYEHKITCKFCNHFICSKSKHKTIHKLRVYFNRKLMKLHYATKHKNKER